MDSLRSIPRQRVYIGLGFLFLIVLGLLYLRSLHREKFVILYFPDLMAMTPAQILALTPSQKYQLESIMNVDQYYTLTKEQQTALKTVMGMSDPEQLHCGQYKL